MSNVTINDEDLQKVKDALNAADDLCTIVIAGKPGSTRAALDLGRMLTDMKRRGVLTR